MNKIEIAGRRMIAFRQRNSESLKCVSIGLLCCISCFFLFKVTFSSMSFDLQNKRYLDFWFYDMTAFGITCGAVVIASVNITMSLSVIYNREINLPLIKKVATNLAEISLNTGESARDFTHWTKELNICFAPDHSFYKIISHQEIANFVAINSFYRDQVASVLLSAFPSLNDIQIEEMVNASQR